MGKPTARAAGAPIASDGDPRAGFGERARRSEKGDKTSVWSILIGLLFILAGLSGEAVLRGTNISWPLIPIGVVLIARGVYYIGEARKQAGVAAQQGLEKEQEVLQKQQERLAQEQQEEDEQERAWKHMLSVKKNLPFAELLQSDSELADSIDSDSDFMALAVKDPHFRARLVADPGFREEVKSDGWYREDQEFDEEFGFGLWCEKCKEKRDERLERGRRRLERQPDPAGVTSDLFARQQALYEALKTFDEQNFSAEMDDSAQQEFGRRRLEVYRRFLSPDEERQWHDTDQIAGTIARKARQEAEDAGAERDDAFETFRSVYDREMAARVPPVLRFYYE